MRYVRFEATNPSPSGRHPGVFALVNGLAQDGRMTDEQARWWRANNDWFNATYTDPASVEGRRHPTRRATVDWGRDSHRISPLSRALTLTRARSRRALAGDRGPYIAWS